MCKAPGDDSGFPYNRHANIVCIHTCSDVLFLYTPYLSLLEHYRNPT